MKKIVFSFGFLLLVFFPMLIGWSIVNENKVVNDIMEIENCEATYDLFMEDIFSFLDTTSKLRVDKVFDEIKEKFSYFYTFIRRDNVTADFPYTRSEIDQIITWEAINVWQDDLGPFKSAMRTIRYSYEWQFFRSKSKLILPFNFPTSENNPHLKKDENGNLLR